MNNNLPNIDTLFYALAQRNLVYNSDFRYFSNADPTTSGSPDGWQYNDDGAAGSIELKNQTLQILTSNDDKSMMTFCQAVSEFPRWEQAIQNQKVTATVDLEMTATAEVTLFFDDGVNQESQSWKPNKDDKTTLSFTFHASASASQLVIGIRCSANAAIITLHSFYANKGEVAIATLPGMVTGVIGEQKQYIATQNAPAEDLSLCNASIELTQHQTRLDTVLNGRFGRGKNNRSLLPRTSGYFMRAWDNGANIDPNSADRTPLGSNSKIAGDKVGSVQPDELIQHKHDIAYAPDELSPSGNTKPITPITELKKGSTEDFGGKETRPKNIYCLFTIKWA